MKKLIFLAALFFASNCQADTTNPGLPGTINFSTGAVDVRRHVLDKINENFKMLSSTGNVINTRLNNLDASTGSLASLVFSTGIADGQVQSVDLANSLTIGNLTATGTVVASSGMFHGDITSTETVRGFTLRATTATIGGFSAFSSTAQAHVGDFKEVFTSTINGKSPIGIRSNHEVTIWTNGISRATFSQNGSVEIGGVTVSHSSITTQGNTVDISTVAAGVNAIRNSTFTAQGIAVNGNVSATAFSGDGSALTGISGATPSTSTVAEGVIITTSSGDNNTVVFISTKINVMGDFYYNVSTAVSLAKNGPGGLDINAEAASRWYSLYVCSNGSTITFIASLNITQPVLPAGYTKWRKVGKIRNDGSSNIVHWYKEGLYSPFCYWSKSSNIINNGSATTFTEIDGSAEIPPASSMVKLKLNVQNTADTDTAIFIEGTPVSVTDVFYGVYGEGSSARTIGHADWFPLYGRQTFRYRVYDSDDDAYVTVLCIQEGDL